MKFYLALFILFPLLTNAQNPSFQWVKGIEIPAGNFSSSSIEDVKVDLEGNVISTGYFRGNFVDFDGDPSPIETFYLSSASVQSGFVQKTAADGTFLWAYKIGNGGTVRSYSIDTDVAGNIYCSGYFFGTNDFDSGDGVSELTSFGGADAFVLKLNADGAFAWVKQLGGSEANVASSLALNESGNITLAGVFEGTVDFDPSLEVSELTSISYSDIFLATLDPNGDLLWVKQIGSQTENSGHEEELEHTVDGSGNIILTGWFYSTLDFDPGPLEFNLTNTGGAALFILKLNSDGDFVWVKHATSSSLNITGEGIDVDAFGNIYATGTFSATVDFDPGPGETELNGNTGNAFVLKLDSNGDFVWVREIDGLRDIRAGDIVVSAEGTSYSTGGFIDTPDFDSSPAAFNLSSGSTSSEDAYVLKLDSEGSFIWAGDMGSVGEDFGTAIALDESGNLFTTGKYTDPGDSYPEMDFDPGPEVVTINNSQQDEFGFFILKLNQDEIPLHNHIAEQNENLVVYPNPSAGQISISFNGEPGPVSVSVFDISGRLLQIQDLNDQSDIKIELPNPAGVYLIRLIDLDNNTHETLIKRM